MKGNIRAVLHPSENLAVKLMRLVDQDEVDLRPSPPCDCLNRADLHGLLGVGAFMDALHDADAADTLRLKGGDGLVDQGQRRDREGDRVCLC